MKRLMMFVFIGVLSLVSLSEAGMIDHERRERMRQRKEAQQLTSLIGLISSIDYQEGKVYVKEEKSGEDKMFVFQDEKLVDGFSDGQKVMAVYNRNTKKLKEMVLKE